MVDYGDGGKMMSSGDYRGGGDCHIDGGGDYAVLDLKYVKETILELVVVVVVVTMMVMVTEKVADMDIGRGKMVVERYGYGFDGAHDGGTTVMVKE
ncbi:hypothetical protein F2Q69_00019346 [Brassica cretica]|uniref:Uncharacterized protein n=1 Tax=Brassica cretica TaxID=69181 RepID=A0A8S9QD01_BRACR|nr:hypothetical protein F2Q69_00019346 [Brassica cretica]